MYIKNILATVNGSLEQLKAKFKDNSLIRNKISLISVSNYYHKN